MAQLTPEQQAELTALLPSLKAKLTTHSGGQAKHLAFPSLPAWLAALIIQLLESLLTPANPDPPVTPPPAPAP